MRAKSTSIWCVKLVWGVLLIAAICSGNALESQANTGAKSEITGHWAAPDCANTQEAVSFTRHFYLKSAPERLELGRYTRTSTGADHLILDLSGVDTAAMRQEDGVLRTGQLLGDGGKKATWDDLQLDNPRDYTNCPQTPAVVSKPLQRLLRYLDRIDEACAVTGSASTTVPRNLSQDCARVLFKAMDDNGDGTITLVEMKLGLASAALLAELAQHRVLDTAGIEQAAVNAKDIASQHSSNLIKAQDANGDSKLDYNEAVSPSDDADLTSLRDMIAQIGALFPAFKLAALKL